MIYDQKNGRQYTFGNLDSRITIRRPTVVIGNDGGVAIEATPVVYSNHKAKIYEDSQNEKPYASSTITGKMITIYMRSFVGIDVRLTDRVEYNSNTYDIQTVESTFGRGRFLKITAIDRDTR